jgi:hypothetical protein
MIDQVAERNKLQVQLIEKVLKDEAFRNALVTSPRETLEDEYKIKIPDDFKIHVLEEDVNTIYLVLPPRTILEKSDELSEAELQTVAGGTNGSYGSYGEVFYSAECF